MRLAFVAELARETLPFLAECAFERRQAGHKFGVGIIEDGLLRHWSLVFAFAVLAAIPWLSGLHWIRWRFSLQTLLIAMTMAAIGLGLIVYVLRVK